MNGNGTIESCEKGAFKVANSWGTEYNQCGLISHSNDGGKTEGYFWVMYDALNLNSTNTYTNWESNFTTTRFPAFCKGTNIEDNNSFDYITVEHKNINLVGEVDVLTSTKYGLDLYCSRTTSDITTYSNTNQISLIPYIGTNPERTYYFNGVILFDFSDLVDPISTYYNGYNWYVKLMGLPMNGENHARFRILDSNGNVVSDYETDDSEQANRAIKYKTLNLIKGDVNYDGIVDENDVQVLLSYVSMTSILSNLQYYLGDYNNDGIVNIADVLSIRLSLPETANLNEIDSMLQSYYTIYGGNNYEK